MGHLRGPRRVGARGHQPPGPDLHAADRQPVHGRRPPARRGVGAPAADPAGGLPLRAHVREERHGPVPRRARLGRRGDPHARGHRRRPDPAQGDGLPDRPRHDRTAVERHRLRPGDGPAAVHQRPADAVRGGRRTRGPQRLPGRHRPGDRACAADRADCSGWSRSEPVVARHAPPRRRPPRSRDRRRGRPRAHAPIRRRPRASRAGPAGVRRRDPAVRDRRPRQPRRVPRAHRARRCRRCPAGWSSSPPSRSTRSRGTSTSTCPRASSTCSGIGVDPDDDAFEAALAAQREARRTRFLAMVERLREIGKPVDAAARAPGPRRRRRPRPADAGAGAARRRLRR